MQINFIRHGESFNNHMYFLYQNGEKYRLDPALSALGEQQATAFAEFLAENRDEFNFDRILISPFQRTLQTADAFAHLYPDTPKEVWTELYEGGGCRETISRDPLVIRMCTGMGRSEMQKRFPWLIVPEGVTEEGWYHRPDVEPKSHVFYRANLVVEQLLNDYGETEEKIALVSHGAFHAHFINAVLKRTHQPNLWFSLENTGMSQVRYDTAQYHGERWWFDFTNRHEWLRGKGLTRDWRVYS